MNIKTPKNIAKVINGIKNLGYADVLLSDRYAFCFKDTEFKRLNEFISVYDNIADKQGKETLFSQLFYVAYDNKEENSCWAVDDEVYLLQIISDGKFECIIIPAPNVLASFEKGWGVPFAELVDYKDN